MITIFQFFVTLVCCNVILSFDSSEKDIKLKYYKGLLESDNEPKFIELSSDSNGLLLKTTRNIDAGLPIFGIQKKHMINGCIFYPFRDMITEVISKFIIKNKLEDIKYFLNLHSIAYQILYYKLANHDKAKKYFFKTRIYESEIYVYEPNLDILNYIDIMFRSIPQSIYSFEDEDIELTKTFIFTSNYQRNVKLYEEILNYTLELKDKEARVLQI